MVNESNMRESNLDVILSPKVIKVFTKGNDAPGSGVDNYFVQTTNKWDVVTIEGELIYTNTIKGEGIRKCSFTYSYETRTW
jgi:hypothetical protein